MESLKYPIYNLSSGKQYPIREIAETIKKLVPNAIIKVGPGMLKGFELRAALDTGRMREEFKFEPTSLKAGIEEFMKYMVS
jgi:nucleoside-diphosphate-sugar epimerase